MKWIDESDDPRVAVVAGVLTGKSGLDSSDVWSLTQKIIAALDQEIPYEYGVALAGDLECVGLLSKTEAEAYEDVQPEFGDIVVRRRAVYETPWEITP